MKFFGTFSLLFITLLQFLFTSSKSISESAIVQNDSQITPKKGGNYVIFVDYDIDEKDPKFNTIAQSYVDQIGQVIIDNLDTFEDKNKLEQFQSEFKVTEGEVEKVHNYKQDHYLYYYNGHFVLMAYLNENILEAVKAIPNVSTVEPDVPFEFVSNKNTAKLTPKKGSNYVIYVNYDIDEKDPKLNTIAQSYVDQIGQIIIDNLDTFEDKDKLEQFQSEFKVTEGEVEKVHNYKQDHYLYYYNGHFVLMAYLNENILEAVKAIPNVATVEPDVPIEFVGNENTTKVTPKKGRNYVIYVESDIDDKNPEFNGKVQSYVDQIGQIIIDNLDTFEDKDKLEQFQSEFKVTEGDVEEVHNYNQDHY
ncbi:hypothetical protein PIROE2DRAFT_10426, partial [Piromyces sp. E2]